MTPLPPGRQETPSLRRRVRPYLWVIMYAMLIVYGSLYPFGDWRMPPENLVAFLVAPWPRYVTRTDIATNILAYLPLGYLLAAVLRRRVGGLGAVMLATETGALLSLVMETLQMFVPGRVSSNLDILTNGAGALAGALLFLLTRDHRWPGRALLAWRRHSFLPGRMIDAGLWLLALWALSQLSLQLPSLIAGNLRHPFIPFWRTLADFSLFKPQQALVYMLEITALGLFTATLVKPAQRVVPMLIAVFAAAVLLKFLAAAVLLKLSVLGRLLSLEALSGFALGLALLLLLLRGPTRRPYRAAFATLAAFVAAKAVDRVVSGAAEWPPFGENLFNVTGLAYLVSEIWPFLAMAYLLPLYLGSRRGGRAPVSR